MVKNLVGPIDLRRDLELHARASGNFDRAIESLFRRDAPQEGKVIAVPVARPVQIERQSVQQEIGTQIVRADGMRMQDIRPMTRLNIFEPRSITSM